MPVRRLLLALMMVHDFVMCYESESINNYLMVFRSIFVKMGHASHYDMMMGESGELYITPIL